MPQSQRDTSDETPYTPFRGPFGGIQSEVPLDFIEGLGFADALNVIFRLGRCTTRFGYNQLPALPGGDIGPILGIFDFFNNIGNRVQIVITPTHLYTWNGTAFTVITGTLTGSSSQIFSFSVLNYKLCFSQGTDPVQLFDGVGGTFAPAAAQAVPAKFLTEVAFHLLAGFTIESAILRPQRIRWTGAFDPTDWTSFNSGFIDLTNDLGPITGLANVYQSGFAWQQKGIVQIVPTGNGIAPFSFVKMSSKAKGNICPFSLAAYGDQIACYVGQDNVYLFDSVQSYPIGDQPMGGGTTRVGARSRIFAELKLTNLSLVYGFITTTIAGNPFNAYWLIIPGGSVWCYHFDEQCWSRFTFSQANAVIQPTVMGDFVRQGGVRIEDLIGTIAQQTWTPATLTNTVPLNDIAIGFTTGGGSGAFVGDIDFTNYSETGWSITSGSIRFGDSMHTKWINRMRIVQYSLSNSPCSYNVAVTNDKNYAQPTTPGVSNTFAAGTMGEQLIDMRLNGLYYTYQIFSDNTLSPISIAEIGFNEDLGQPYRAT